MKYFVPFYIILQFLLPSTGFTQTVNFEDGFEDGNLTSNPTWTGDTMDFDIIAVNGNYLLQLQAADAGSSYLTASTKITEGYWDFYIDLDGFNPSNNNQAFIYIISDTQDLTSSVNGYALQAGESLSGDVFRLFKIRNGIKDKEILTGTTNISSGGEYRIKIIRDSSGNWSLEVGKGYTGVLKREATGYDNEFTTTSYFGVVINYTKSNIRNFYFDFKIDLPPFMISEVTANDSNIDLTLNRAYNEETVDKSKFWVDGEIGSPASVTFPASDVIRLNYSNSLPSGKYTLTAPLVEDLHGLELSKTTASVIVPGKFQLGDLIINEFTYDPPSGQAEYVEIKNTSDKYLDIKNWQLGDNSALNTITPTSYMIEPNSYLVLSEDTTSLFSTFGHRNYIQMTSFRSLNNTGDAIRLIAGNGSTADSLTYTPSWDGRDVALERRSAYAPSIFPENWDDSPHINGGTPGLPNEVDTDRNPPSLDELTVSDATTLQLTFSERLETDIALTSSNYSLKPQSAIKSVSVDSNAVTLTLDQELLSDKSYEVTAKNLQDIFGNAIQSTTREVTYLRFSTPLPGDVVVNEILYTQQDGRGPEFVELYNASTENFNLSGWKLGDATDFTMVKSDLKLLSGKYLVFTDSRAFADTLDEVHYLTGFPSLNNAGDAIYLQSPTGITLDSLFYRDKWHNGDKGTSLERKDPRAASNDPANWQVHPGPTRFSAANMNVSYRKDKTPPNVIFSRLLSDGSTEVRFSEFISLTSDLNFKLGEQPLNIAFFDSTQGNIIRLRSSSPKVPDTKTATTLSVFNLSDVRGNVMPDAEIPLAYEMKPRTIAINEIMYNPLNESKDNLPDQSEYIELRNTTDHAVSLEGIYLHDAPDEDGQVQSLIPVTTYSKWIQPQGVALIYADEADEFTQSQTANYFDISKYQAASIIRVDRGTLSLASTDDAVYLSDSTGTVIDSVFYADSWHNPNLLDIRGVSLERINPAGPGNDPSNWGSSTHEKGGSPFAENTLYQISESSPDHTGISFSPNPFSPDNDGFDDNLFINYRLDAPDYLIKVRIFDRYGRLVRKLADGQPAGSEGSLIWDGRRGDGTRNRIGIYIVVFEAFNSTQSSNQAFKKTVVLARRLN